MTKIAKLRPLYVERDGTLWASRGLQLFRSRDQGQTLEPVANYAGNFVQRISRLSRLVDRFTRSGFQALLPLSDGSCLATVRGAILKLDPGSTRFREVFVIPRGSRPLNICPMPDDRLLWGEYFFNDDREPVHIYGSEDGGDSWDIVYTFSAGAVRHVHGIFYDSYRRGCWVLTGDDDDESKILFSSDAFRTLDTVFGGTQQFRSACLIPRRDGLVAGTDTPFDQNYILWLDPEAGKAEKLQAVSGSIFYASRASEWLALSVVPEPSRVNRGKLASIWISRDGRSWQELYRRKRDIWQPPYLPLVPDILTEMPYFQHGALVFPLGENGDPYLYAYGQALVGADDACLCWNLAVDASGCTARQARSTSTSHSSTARGAAETASCATLGRVRVDAME